MGSNTHTHGESTAVPPNSSPCTPIPVACSNAATTWRSMARSTSVAKSLPFLGTAESARWPSRNRGTAASRIADAPSTRGATSASKSIAALLPYRSQCLRQGEPPGVEGFADDGALDPAGGEGGQVCQGTQVVQAGHTAGCDHRGCGAIGHGGQQVEIGAAQRAVLGDIGDHEPRTSLSVKAFQHFPQIAPVGLPAAPAQPVLAGWIALVELHV